MTASHFYESDESSFFEFVKKLKELSNEEIADRYRHVCHEHFHPDTEFAEFCLEGLVSDDDAIDAIIAEHDLRMSNHANRQAALVAA